MYLVTQAGVTLSTTWRCCLWSAHYLRKIRLKGSAHRNHHHRTGDRNRAFYILPWYSIARRQRSGIRIHSSVFFCMYKGRLHTAHLHTCCSALYRRTGGWRSVCEGQCVESHPHYRGIIGAFFGYISNVRRWYDERTDDILSRDRNWVSIYVITLDLHI